MTNPKRVPADPDAVAGYEIRIRGHLGEPPDDRFAGWAVLREAGGETRLSRPAVDQAALHGLLKRLRDLGVPLLSVARTPSDDSAAPRESAGADGAAPHPATPSASEEDPHA